MLSGRLFSFSASMYLYDPTGVDSKSDNVRGFQESLAEWVFNTAGRLDGIMSEAISFTCIGNS